MGKHSFAEIYVVSFWTYNGETTETRVDPLRDAFSSEFKRASVRIYRCYLTDRYKPDFMILAYRTAWVPEM